MSGLVRVLRFPFNAVLDFLVEDRCALCRRPHHRPPRDLPPLDGPVGYLVDPLAVRRLLGAVAVANHPVCRRCAGELVVAKTAGVLHDPGGCRANGDETGQSGGAGASGPGGPVAVVSPFMTTDGVLEIVHRLKFGGYAELAHPIGRSVAWALRRLAPGGEGFGLLVPTPMDARSRRRRGFNQAERIAEALAAELGVALAAGVLQKTLRTERQSQTPREMRAANVRGAFSCPAEAGSVVGGRPVILVDDLVTSGATAAVCAAALRGAGAASVTVACFGRAL